MSTRESVKTETAWSNTEGRKACARRVRKLRRARGMSQQELACEAGMHRTHLVRFEGGKVNLTLDAFFALAAGLGVQPSELLPGDDELHLGEAG